MFCPKCGSKNQDNAKFCGKCGTALSTAPAAAPKPVHNQPKGMKAPEIGKTASDIKSEVGKTASNIKSEFVNWLSKYLDIWRRCRTLENKERNLWFGIHGGILLLLLCLIFVPLFSNGGRGGANIEKLLKEAAKDGEISEDDIIKLAQAISNYEDIQELEQIWQDNYEDMEEISGFLNLCRDVSDECRDMSGLAELMDQYEEWYDRDGLSEKIYDRSDQVDCIYISSFGILTSMGKNGDSFQNDNNGRYVEVEWFAYADSNDITFVKTTYGSTSKEAKTEQYDGQYEVSGSEILVKLEGKEYRISEATTDRQARQAESFSSMARGTWAYSAEFYNMIERYLGSWASLTNSNNEKPLYVTFNGNPGNQLVVMGTDGIYLERLRDFSVEQGEGKTATFSSEKGSVQVSYDMSDGNLVITVDGTDYVLSPSRVANTGTYDTIFGTKN